MATHSSILAWRTPWTEEPGKLQSGVAELDTTQRLMHTHTHTRAYSAVYQISWCLLRK